MNRIDNCILVVLFFILYASTMYINSDLFIDVRNTAKNYCFIFIGVIFLVYYILTFWIHRKYTFEVLIRYFVLIIVCLSELQAIYGIFQYFKLVSGFSGFLVVGSFDNPAGFAGSLCVSLPFFLYFLQGNRKQIFVTYVGIDIVCLAIILSESRTGIFCVFILFLIVILHRIKLHKKLCSVW